VVALANNQAGVDVLYAQGKMLTRVAADRAVYAGYSAMLPYICPDLGAVQRKAVSDQVKAPLVYVKRRRPQLACVGPIAEFIT